MPCVSLTELHRLEGTAGYALMHPEVDLEAPHDQPLNAHEEAAYQAVKMFVCLGGIDVAYCALGSSEHLRQRALFSSAHRLMARRGNFGDMEGRAVSPQANQMVAWRAMYEHKEQP